MHRVDPEMAPTDPLGVRHERLDGDVRRLGAFPGVLYQAPSLQ